MGEKEVEEMFDEKYLASILQRNPHLLTQLKIHPLRWRFITAWILVFTLLVFWVLRDNRSQIAQLNQTKASLVSLQKTNCALRDFLRQAQVSRLKAAKAAATPAERRSNLQSARGYQRLVRIFPLDGCEHALRGH